MKWPLVWRRTMEREITTVKCTPSTVELEVRREAASLARSNRSLRGANTKLRTERDELKAELACIDEGVKKRSDEVNKTEMRLNVALRTIDEMKVCEDNAEKKNKQVVSGLQSKIGELGNELYSANAQIENLKAEVLSLRSKKPARKKR